MDISPGIIFGLLAMAGYGLASAIAQAPVKKIGAVRTIFFRNAMITLMIAPILLFDASENVLSWNYVAIALAISAVCYVPFAAFYKALEIGKIGIVTPVANSSVIYTILLSVFFFNETLTQLQLYSIALIVGGTIIISIDFRDLKNSDIFKFSSGVPLAILSSLLWGLGFFLFKIPVDVLGPILTSLIIEGGIAIYSGLHLFASGSFARPDNTSMKQIFLVAFFGAIGTLAYTLGIKTYGVSIVAALAFASPLVSVLYARAVYRERLCIQQYAASAMMIAGIIFISYFG